MSLPDRAWLDASWHPPGLVGVPLPFDPRDRGLLLGDGVFDTALVLGGRMVWREAHLARLQRHARCLGIDVAPGRLDAAADGVLAGLAGGHGALRVTLTRGAGPRGLAPPQDPSPTILATVAPFAAGALFAPLRLATAATRRNDTSPLSRVKSLGYGDAVLAAAAARAGGYDEALFRNTAGRIACVGSGNLFALFGNRLVTPPLEDGVLDGVVRAFVLAGAARAGLVAVEASLGDADLAAADGVIVTNSLRLAAPVVAIDARILEPARQALAAVVATVAEAVRADCGIDPRDLAHRHG